MLQKLFKPLYAGAALILILAVAVRCFYAVHKPDMYIDETLSIVLSEYNIYGWDEEFEDNRPWNGHSLRQAAMWNDPSLKDSLNDVIRLRENNRDNPHTNLYYSLLTLWHTGFDSTDLRAIMYRGISLNFVFLFIGFGCACALGRRIFLPHAGGSAFMLLFLALAFLNPIGIGNSLIIRPYALQETLFLAFALMFVRSCQKLEQQGRLKLKLIITFALITALFLLSGYFSLIFVLLILGLMALIRIPQGWKQAVGLPALIFGLGLWAALIIYPNYFDGLFGYRSVEAADKLDLNYLKDNAFPLFEQFFLLICDSISLFGIGFSLIAIALIALLRRNVQLNTKLGLLLGLGALIWCAGIFYVAPYKEIRYLMPAIPVLMLLPVAAAAGLRDSTAAQSAAVASRLPLICLGLILVSVLRLSADSARIPHLDSGCNAVIKELEAATGKRTIIMYEPLLWKNSYIFPYADAKRRYVFAKSCYALSSAMKKHLPDAAVVLERKYKDECMPVIQYYRKRQPFMLIDFDVSKQKFDLIK